jgi:peptide/nickel transport system substrate-binding protein
MKERVGIVSIYLLTASLIFLPMQPVEAKNLNWASVSDLNSMDPYGQTMTNTIAFLLHLYDPLVRYNRTLKIEPALATSWKVIEPSVWRFSLRKGVKFHNGNPFNADDVVASIKRVTHPRCVLRGNVPGIKDIRKVDDYTVDIVLTGSYPLLLNDLTNIAMMDQEWMTENKCLDPIDPAKGESSYTTTHTNGTGAFILESWRPDAEAVAVVNPNWWDKPEHNITRMVYTPIKSDATRVAAMLSGRLDYMYPAPLQDLDRINGTKGFKAVSAPSLRTIMLAFNQAPNEPISSNIKGKNPLKDVRVRKALYYAIDIDSIQKRIMRGMSRNAGLYVAPEIPGFHPDLNTRLPYDPSAAKKLLVEAGYPEGFEIGLDCPNDLYINDEAISQAITSMWARIGVKAHLTAQPSGVYMKKSMAGTVDVWMLGWATEPMLDSFSILAQVLSSKRDKYGVRNPGGYGNPRVDELIDKIAVELDETKRLKMIYETFAIVREDIPIIPLHQQPLTWALRDGVQVVHAADNKPRLWYARID